MLNRPPARPTAMLACILKEPGKPTLESVPIPNIGPGDVLVRMRASGICGTDLEKIRGGYGPGGILGHEVSGVVEEVGRDTQGLSPGDRVVVHHHVPCYKCHYCQRGDYTMCDIFKTTNLDPCGFAEYFRVPEANVIRGAVIPLSHSVGYEEAALLEPTACCIRALDKARVQAGENVLIVGLGPTGLTHLQLLGTMHAGRILGTDVQKIRLDIALKLGANSVIHAIDQDVTSEVTKTIGHGADLVIVSTGNPNAISQALSTVRKGGRALLFGAPAQGTTVPFDASSFFSRQISLLSSYSCVEGEIIRALNMVRNKSIDLGAIITHRFPLEKAVEALAHARSSVSSVKTIVTP